MQCPWESERVSKALGPNLEAVLSYHVGAGNRAQVQSTEPEKLASVKTENFCTMEEFVNRTSGKASHDWGKRLQWTLSDKTHTESSKLGASKRIAHFKR